MYFTEGIQTSLKKQLDPRACGDPESFVRGGPSFENIFFLWGGRIQIPLQVSHHWPPSVAFCWHADDGPTLNLAW